MHDRAAPIANGTENFEQWGVYYRDEDGVTADTFTNTPCAERKLAKLCSFRVLDTL